MHFTRRGFLKRSSQAVAAGYLTQLMGPFSHAEPAKKPNLLVILVDDLGFGDLSCYGAEDLQSPHIDRLISQGIRFVNAYANCPVCSPTRAALLTGRYQDLVGVPGVIRTHDSNSWGYLSPECHLMPEWIKEQGYHTALVGKWHLGLQSPNLPNERGFDHFHGFLGDMMDDYYHHRRHDINYMRLNKEEIDPEGHATDLFSDWACDYLQERKDSDQPFFLYLAYNAPHTPIQPPEEWLQKVKERESNISEKRAKLVALIEHMDHGIGKVLDTLEKTDQSDNTIVVFASDNGGQSNVGANNGPYRSGKGTVYEGGIRVPMGVRWPGVIQPGTETNRMALSMDIMPTLFEACGIPIRHEIDGVSFLPALQGKERPQLDRDLFFRRREGGRQFQGKTIEAIRRGDWKLLRNKPEAPFELYNLKEDPYEQTDLAQKEREKRKELEEALIAQLERYEKVPWKRPSQRE